MISRLTFPDRELLVDFARYVLAERAAMCPAERVADSLAQVAARFRKLKPNKERGAISATAPKLV